MRGSAFGVRADDHPHEQTAWLRARVAQRVRLARAARKATPESDLVVAPLGRTGWSDPIEDRSCDRCRVYCPPAGKQGFHLVRLHPEPWVTITGGLCARCARKEGIA